MIAMVPAQQESDSFLGVGRKVAERDPRNGPGRVVAMRTNIYPPHSTALSPPGFEIGTAGDEEATWCRTAVSGAGVTPLGPTIDKVSFWEACLPPMARTAAHRSVCGGPPNSRVKRC